MARPTQGQIVPRQTKRGINWYLRVTYKGERILVHIGPEWEGWPLERVEEERDHIGRMIERGEWIPPDKTRPAPAQPKPVTGDVLLRDFAATVLAKKKLRLTKNGEPTAGYYDLEWKVVTALDFLGDWPVAAITSTVIDDELVTKALRERQAIEQARALGKPLMERVTDTRGRTYERRRRGLSRASINKVLAGLNVVMKEAKRRGLIDVNPVDHELRVKAEKALRSYLQAAQIKAALDAAGLLEVEGRGLTWQKVKYIRESEKPAVALAKELRISDVTIGKVRRGLIWADEAGARRRNDIARRAVIAVLIMAGLRIDECCELIGADVDLAAGVIRIREEATKGQTAGARVIPMVPALREILVEHRAERPYGSRDWVFPTRNGTKNTPDNLREHVVDKVRDRANELLAERDEEPIAHMTPHSLRRTFASLLAVVGVSTRRAMTLLGHSDGKFTLSVYQQDFTMSEAAVATLERCLGGDLDDLFLILSGRSDRGGFRQPKGNGDKKMPSEPVEIEGWEG